MEIWVIVIASMVYTVLADFLLNLNVFCIFFPFVGGESCDFTYISIFYKKKGGKIKAIMDNKYLCSSYLDDYEYV